jgi:hypothetical protein
MAWALTGSHAEVCSCELMRINDLGLSCEVGASVSGSGFSWVG